MGGLTVMRALKARLPDESFVYLGDTARLPYGTKSADTVTRYAVQASATLMKHDIKLLVVACNTASAAALPTLIEALGATAGDRRDRAGAQAAVAAAPEGPIAVIATEGTVRGGAYVRAIQAARAAYAGGAAGLSLVRGAGGRRLARRTTSRNWRRTAISIPCWPPCQGRAGWCLGCTHFPVLKETIAKVAGPGLVLIDSAETTAAAVEKILKEKSLLTDGQAQAATLPGHRCAGTLRPSGRDLPGRTDRSGKRDVGGFVGPLITHHGRA